MDGIHELVFLKSKGILHHIAGYHHRKLLAPAKITKIEVFHETRIVAIVFIFSSYAISEASPKTNVGKIVEIMCINILKFNYTIVNFYFHTLKMEAENLFL